MSKEIANVSINILKVHPRNNEFFDDISGKEYEEFKNSIKEEGIISEIIVAPDMTIISGHQRFKAAKELGIQMVPIRIREDLIDEDKKLKLLLAANFQRPQNDEKKKRKIAAEYVRLCGYKHGGDREASRQVGALPLEQIATQLGTSERNLQRALSIERNLTEPMKELLDSGVISKTVAADVVAALDEEEQVELFASLDAAKKYTKTQVQQYIDEIKRLKNQPPQVIDKTDYSALSRLEDLENKVKELEAQKNILERKVKLNEEDAERYKKLKSDIEFLTKQKSDLGRQIDSATELAGLTVKLQHLLEGELAPIKFKRCMEVLDSSDVCVSNLTDIVTKLDSWSDEIKKLLMKSHEYIVDVE